MFLLAHDSEPATVSDRTAEPDSPAEEKPRFGKQQIIAGIITLDPERAALAALGDPANASALASKRLIWDRARLDLVETRLFRQ